MESGDRLKLHVQMCDRIRYDLALIISRLSPTPEQRLSFIRRVGRIFSGREVSTYRDIYFTLVYSIQTSALPGRRHRAYVPSSRALPSATEKKAALPPIRSSELNIGIITDHPLAEKASRKRILPVSAAECIYCLNIYIPNIIAVSGSMFVVTDIMSQPSFINKSTFYDIVAHYLHGSPLEIYKALFIRVEQYRCASYVDLSIISEWDDNDPDAIYFSDSKEMMEAINYILPNCVTATDDGYIVNPPCEDKPSAAEGSDPPFALHGT